jgi:2-polyprenyl-3-methyl-5-hydroxy-6-metoxy-1,4-benzoquinol methylase
MNIVTQFQLIQQLREVELSARPMSLTFVCPHALVDAAVLYLTLEPEPECSRVAHTVPGGQVQLEPLDEQMVRVRIVLDRVLVAALVMHHRQPKALNLYRLGWQLPVLELQGARWAEQWQAPLQLFDTSRSLVGGNHWGVDSVFLVGNELHLYGWAVTPVASEKGGPSITVDGTAASVQSTTPLNRDLYWLQAPDRLEGFHAVAPVRSASAYVRVSMSYPADERQGITRFALYQYLGDVQHEGTALPDLGAIHRVSGPLANHVSFVNGGKSDYERFKLLIGKHHGLEQGMKVLDWGVGCGRLARHFAREGYDIHGIDIDAENVRWCNEHIGAGNYFCVDLYPPTGLPSDSYDVIISSSVLSHLTESTMRAWLAEINRLLTPGGRALLSFNGDGTSFLWAGASQDALAGLVERGMFDEWRTPDLDGAVKDAETYYRLTLFRSEHALKIFSEYFTVHAVELGVTSGSQDIAVLQKKA